MCEKRVSLRVPFPTIKIYVPVWLKSLKNRINDCCPLTLFFTAPSNSLDCKKRDKNTEL